MVAAARPDIGLGGGASRTHYTPDEVREFFGEDLREEIEQLIANPARDDGDGPRIAHADIARVIDGVPLDASMRTSRVVRVDGLLARVPAAVLADDEEENEREQVRADRDQPAHRHDRRRV